MKKLIYLLFLLFFSLITFAKKSNHDFNFGNPVSFGDPFIILYKDTYYAYGTHAENGIEVYTSPDLVVWDKADILALDKKDSWQIHPRAMYIADVSFTQDALPRMTISNTIIKAILK